MTVVRLSCPVQHYAWGSTTSIPRLLGKEAPQQLPWAELWMGAHPKAPSLVEGEKSLAAYIARDPELILGTSALGTSLPFLFKVLAASAPLSIQCHPNKEQAEAGFAAEEAAGIPHNAPNRNYRDSNHKPELIVALEEFWALKGFRDPQDIATLFAQAKLHSAAPLLEQLSGQNGLQEFFAALLGQDAQETRVLLSELADGLDNLPAPEALWTKRLLSRYPRDQSATAALVLQLVRLEAGEGLYLGAGELHAYLSGTGLEIMANSDNVLRGGLTPKHVDASELLRVLRFTHAPVQVLSAEGCGPVRHYKTPCKEFALARLTLGSSEQTEYQPASPCAQIWLCLGDGAELQWGTAGTLTIRRGEAVFVTANTPKITVRTKPGESCDLWLAGYETSP